MRLALLLLSLPGCFYVDRTVECEISTFPIGEDELVGEMSVSPAEVLAVVQGPFTFDAAYDDGTPVSGGGEVTRGAGEIMATERQWVELSAQRRFGRRPAVMREDVPCEDSFQIPMDLSLATDDQVVLFTADGHASPLIVRPDGVPDFFEVRADVDPTDILLAPTRPEPGAVLGLALQWVPTGLGDGYVSLWWRGERYHQLLRGPAR